MFATSLLFYEAERGVRIMASLSHAAEFAFGNPAVVQMLRTGFRACRQAGSTDRR